MSDLYTTPHPLAGQTVTLADGREYHIEDWNDRVFDGTSWMFMQGHAASLAFATRAALAGLPLNNEVVYGKVGPYGHLVHVEEIPGGGA